MNTFVIQLARMNVKMGVAVVGVSVDRDEGFGQREVFAKEGIDHQFEMMIRNFRPNRNNDKEMCDPASTFFKVR